MSGDAAPSSTPPSTLSAVKRRVAAVVGRREAALTTLPTLPSIPTLPTLDADGNVVAPGSEPVPGPTATPPQTSAGTAPTLADACAFLFREARLLDDRQWDEWLELWEPDARYSMPSRRTVAPEHPGRPTGDELTPPGGAWWFDESREQLGMRVAKLKTGKAWAEEPPSRTRRFVTNVECDAGEGGVALVRSNLLIHRGRRDSDVEWFSCGRTDQLVTRAEGVRLAGRQVVLDANVAAGDNLILFF